MILQHIFEVCKPSTEEIIKIFEISEQNEIEQIIQYINIKELFNDKNFRNILFKKFDLNKIAEFAYNYGFLKNLLLYYSPIIDVLKIIFKQNYLIPDEQGNVECEDCLNCKNCIMCKKCENCNGCIILNNCTNSHKCLNCNNCNGLIISKNCISCNSCINCENCVGVSGCCNLTNNKK